MSEKKTVRHFSESISSIELIDGKTITRTKTTSWSDTPEAAEGFWKDIDEVLNAASRAMDKMSKSTVHDTSNRPQETKTE